MAPLLEVDNLSVRFHTPDGDLWAVRELSYDLEQGRCLAVVGESGSGKSASVQALLGLATGALISGSARFDGTQLLGVPSGSLRHIRGGEIGMVFQDPLSALHPQFRVGAQIAEQIRLHTGVNRSDARKRAVELLAEVGIADPARRADEFPHEFSGGMRQRVLIAMAISCNPRLLIADEPTTALDVTVQAQILELLDQLRSERNMAMILVTHDLGVVSHVADDVLVMYAGRSAEIGARADVFGTAAHPYTRGLLQSLPVKGERGPLHPVPGQPPTLLTLTGTGDRCAFAPRCAYVNSTCLDGVPPLRAVGASTTHIAACTCTTVPTTEVDAGGEQLA